MTIRLDRRLATTALLTSGIFLFAPLVHAQAELECRAEIEGHVELTGSPAVLAILAAQGLNGGFVGGSSVNPPNLGLSGTDPGLSGQTPTGGDYLFAVETCVQPSVTQVAYEVDGVLFIGADAFGQSEYRLPRRTTPLLVEDDLHTLSFTECLGAIRVQFSQPVSGITHLRADRPDMPYDKQSIRYGTAPGTTVVDLLVSGDGATYSLTGALLMGSDIYTDQLTFRCSQTATVGCGEVVPVVCDVPTADVGRIIGLFDMLGEFENRVNDRTLVEAFAGPENNYRRDTLLASPSSGAFELENLLHSLYPNVFGEPPVGYVVGGDMNFRTGRRSEYFNTPDMENTGLGTVDQHRVMVTSGVTENLANTFVMTPGFVGGDLLLRGVDPNNPSTRGSCLSDIYRDSDTDVDGNGVPDNLFITESYVGGYGVNTVAPVAGTTTTALNAHARVLFEGGFDPAVQGFSGDYEIVLASLLGQASIWRVGDMGLRFIDAGVAGDPLSYQNSKLQIVDRIDGVDGDRHAPEFLIDADAHTHDIQRCFGEIQLNFTTSDGTFFNPRVENSFGTFDGTDFTGNPARYDVPIQFASGSPQTQADATSDGVVVMCVPEGTYDFNPRITFVHDNGELSEPGLDQVRNVSCGCGEVCKVTPPIDVNIDNPAIGCAADDEVTVDGTVVSTTATQIPVDEILVSVRRPNQAPFFSDTVCSGPGGSGACGMTPRPYSLPGVPLMECENNVVVRARSGDKVSFRDRVVTYDPEPPLLQGCQDLVVQACAGQGATATFNVTATDNCTANPAVVCDHASGSSFPAGVTTVTCSAQDSCNVASCTFNVVVEPINPTPTSVCPPNATITLSPNACNAAPSFTATASDSCGNASSASHTFAFSAPGSQVFTYTFPEVPGAAPCTQTVTAVDATPPLAICSGAQRECTGANTPVTTTCTSGDACDATPTTTSTAQAAYPLGTHSFQCTATDDSGNSATSSCTVIIADTTPPTITQPPNISRTICSNDPVLVTLPRPTASDVCAGQSVQILGRIVARNNVGLNPIVDIPANGQVPLRPGTYVIVWIALDQRGNARTVQQTVTITGVENMLICCGRRFGLFGDNNPNLIIAPPNPFGVAVEALGGEDLVLTRQGPDCILGGLASDSVHAGGGNDLVYGGDGDDSLYAGTTGVFTAHGGAGMDAIFANQAASSLLYGGPGDDQFFGSPGNDQIFPGSGADLVSAGGGNDTITLYHACEVAGAKLISGGPGNDTLVTPVPPIGTPPSFIVGNVTVVGVENVVINSAQGYLSDCF